MTRILSDTRQLKNFLSNKKTLDLPSNLLNKDIQKGGIDIKYKTFSASLGDKNRTNSDRKKQGRYFNQFRSSTLDPSPLIIEQKKIEKSPKNVLYKRLSDIRDNNEEIANLSFSKMLARMVVMDENQENAIQQPFQFRMRQTSYVRPIRQRQMQFQLKQPKKNKKNENRSTISRSSDYTLEFNTLNQSEIQNQYSKTSKDFAKKQISSRMLFKKYYMPHSEIAQNNYLGTINPDDKYVYENGKRIQCKRIHNFYTGSMFRKGYQRCVLNVSGERVSRK